MNICIWTDADLDGACSNLILHWLLGPGVKIKTKVSTAKKFEKEFSGWYKNNKKIYDKIFICDIDTSSLIDIVDRKGIVIIDHHSYNILSSNKYKNAKIIIEEENSTAMLIFKHWRKDLSLTKEQKLLINLVDDYDSYTLQYGDLTKDLNKIFWQYSGDRCDKFAKEFNNGFSGFTELQKNSINLYNKKLNETIRQLEVTTANILIGNHNRKVVMSICMFGINDIAAHLLSQYCADICILVNPNTGTVSFRRSSECKTSLHKLAATLTNGGGHEAAAGGKITDIFLNFAKSFTI